LTSVKQKKEKKFTSWGSGWLVTLTGRGEPQAQAANYRILPLDARVTPYKSPFFYDFLNRSSTTTIEYNNTKNLEIYSVGLELLLSYIIYY